MVLACLKVRKLAPRIKKLDSLHVLIGCGVRLRTTSFHSQASPQLHLSRLNDERQPLLTYMSAFGQFPPDRVSEVNSK